MGVDVDFKFPDLNAKMKRAEEAINLFIAAQIQFNRGMLFDQEGAYNGHPKWADLKFRNGQILTNRGTLRKSIAPYNPRGTAGPDGIVRFSSDTITVGTKLGYARLMNDGTTKMPGGVLRPVNAKALKIPVPKGMNAGPAAKAIQSGASARKLAALNDKMSRARTSAARTKIQAQIDRLQRRLAKGGGDVDFIFRKSVKIPARPFDNWTEEDVAELEEALSNKVVEILNG